MKYIEQRMGTDEPLEYKSVDDRAILGLQFHLPDGKVSISVRDGRLEVYSDHALVIMPNAANKVTITAAIVRGEGK